MLRFFFQTVTLQFDEGRVAVCVRREGPATAENKAEPPFNLCNYNLQTQNVRPSEIIGGARRSANEAYPLSEALSADGVSEASAKTGRGVCVLCQLFLSV
jgi:hypothetical protein